MTTIAWPVKPIGSDIRFPLLAIGPHIFLVRLRRIREVLDAAHPRPCAHDAANFVSSAATKRPHAHINMSPAAYTSSCTCATVIFRRPRQRSVLWSWWCHYCNIEYSAPLRVPPLTLYEGCSPRSATAVIEPMSWPVQEDRSDAAFVQQLVGQELVIGHVALLAGVTRGRWALRLDRTPVNKVTPYCHCR